MCQRITRLLIIKKYEMNTDFDYIKNAYKVPAEIGREVIFEKDKKGVIVGSSGNYILVNFYADKPNNIKPLHPTYEVEYLGIGKVRKMTRGQERYKEYLSCEWDMSFIDFCKRKTKKNSLVSSEY